MTLQLSFSSEARGIRRGGLLAGLVAMILFVGAPSNAQTNSATLSTNVPGWISQPLSVFDALNFALQQNGTLQKARADLEANYGLIMQTRAVALPRVQTHSAFNALDSARIDQFPFAGGTNGSSTNTGPQIHVPSETWNADIRIVQNIYQGGQVLSALRAAKLSREQALLQYQTAVSDTELAVRVAYYDVLLGAQQIKVEEASVNLLGRELDDQQKRFDAGTVPRFNVLRAEVAVANERPKLIHARNDYRIAKNNLSNLLGFNLPKDVQEDVPLQLTGTLDAQPYAVDLSAAITQALEKRTELEVLRKQEGLQREALKVAHAGYKPNIDVFAGYGAQNSNFHDDLDHVLRGWELGAELNWNFFDGFLTQGKIRQARAQYEHAKVDVDDTSRRIELEVRTAYSTFIEAKEVLQSQEKVQEQAEEALRLANARTDAGTGTQLDVLDAETALTQARTTQVLALHDYAVARARLERAMGANVAAQ